MSGELSGSTLPPTRGGQHRVSRRLVKRQRIEEEEEPLPPLGMWRINCWSTENVFVLSKNDVHENFLISCHHSLLEIDSSELLSERVVKFKLNGTVVEKSCSLRSEKNLSYLSQDNPCLEKEERLTPPCVVRGNYRDYAKIYSNRSLSHPNVKQAVPFESAVL